MSQTKSNHGRESNEEPFTERVVEAAELAAGNQLRAILEKDGKLREV